MAGMLAAFEEGALQELQGSIQAQDPRRFAAACRATLAACHACHVAAEKPLLRLRMPQRPAEMMMEFLPAQQGGP